MYIQLLIFTLVFKKCFPTFTLFLYFSYFLCGKYIFLILWSKYRGKFFVMP